MLESVRKSLEVPRVPVKAIWSVTTLGSFLWLLAQDMVHPMVVYLLQLYLTF